MSRSLKKGPYVDEKLLKKVLSMAALEKKEPIKTWARVSVIPPEFVGAKFLVHNGKNFIQVAVTESMVGHRLGEFAPTRRFVGHGKMTEKSKTKK